MVMAPAIGKQWLSHFSSGHRPGTLTFAQLSVQLPRSNGLDKRINHAREFLQRADCYGGLALFKLDAFRSDLHSHHDDTARVLLPPLAGTERLFDQHFLAAFLLFPALDATLIQKLRKQLLPIIQTGHHAFLLDNQWVRADLGLRDEREGLEDRG